MPTILKFFSPILLLAVATISHAEDSNHRAIDYQDINDLVHFVNNEAQSKLVSLSSKVSVEQDGLAISDVKMWMTGKDSKSIAINIAEDGSVILPELTQDDAKESLLHINQPKGAVSISLSVSINPPDSLQISYQDLFVVLEDTNNFMSKMMGAASLFMPDMDTLKLVFEQPATIEIASKRKTYRYQTDEDNSISLDKNSRLMSENPTVVFSRLAVSVTPED